MASLAAGSTLCDGRYRLDAVLGRGGMSIVWRATDLQLEREVAIKVISDVLATDPRFVARFEREARLAARLNHPNLVKLFDFSVDTERPFLIMEYVPGGTLAEARGRQLDAETLARDLLDAVAHIHAGGILHRDIKPANVLLGADGSPRLTDFGIARGEETSALTQTGQVLGTLRYIAPEVAAGEPASAQSDLYSLGVLLGEVAGESPPEHLTSLIVRMTATDPAARPSSAAQALAELDPTRRLPPTAAEEPVDPTIALPESPTNPRARVDAAGPPPCAARLPARRARRRAPARLPAGFSLGRPQAIGAAALLVVLLLVVVIAASSGGNSKLNVASPRPAPAAAPAGAPANQQLDRLEQIVRSAQKR